MPHFQSSMLLSNAQSWLHAFASLLLVLLLTGCTTLFGSSRADHHHEHQHAHDNELEILEATLAMLTVVEAINETNEQPQEPLAEDASEDTSNAFIGLSFDKATDSLYTRATLQAELSWPQAPFFGHSSHIGVSLALTDDFYAGFELGHRVALDTGLSPFIGVGLLAADRRIQCDESALAYDEDCPIAYLFSFYPEIGLQWWLSPRWRLTGFARYQTTSHDFSQQFVSYGIGLSGR